MSRKANPTVIGAFVVGAVVIAVVAVLVLTSGQLLQKKLNVVMYFDGSVKGLSVGAPVSYRGVQIGTVTKIEIVLSPNQDARIPVTVEIDPSAFTLVGYDDIRMDLNEFRQGLYKSCRNEGLRGQLQLKSLLTGQLFIQLDYFPGTEARFVETGEVAEIPTVPTTLQELSGVLQGFPVKVVLTNLEKAVASLAKLTGDEKIHDTIQSVDQAFKDISQLVANLDSRTEPLQPALVEGRKTLAQATATLVAAKRTFQRVSATLVPMKRLVGDDSELLESIEEAFVAMTEAAQAVAALADTLERHPEAIFKGKGAGGGD
jgi:paraquat-inducible protein B